MTPIRAEGLTGASYMQTRNKRSSGTFVWTFPKLQTHVVAVSYTSRTDVDGPLQLNI
jgi:hypothetical protein